MIKDKRPHLVAALAYVREWGVAIDGGANVGAYAAMMAERFAAVLAFEPNPTIHEQLVAGAASNVRPICLGLADRPRHGRMAHDGRHIHKSSWYIDFNSTDESKPAVETRALDDYALRNVGLIKLDIEGAEMLALEGARRTIAASRPVMMIESSRKTDPMRRYGLPADGVFTFCREIGARHVESHRYDHIFAFD